jgi:hypothetical protein
VAHFFAARLRVKHCFTFTCPAPFRPHDLLFRQKSRKAEKVAFNLIDKENLFKMNIEIQNSSVESICPTLVREIVLQPRQKTSMVIEKETNFRFAFERPRVLIPSTGNAKIPLKFTYHFTISLPFWTDFWGATK